MTSKTARPRTGFSSVKVAPAVTGFAIHLDDKPLRTPAGTEVVVPSAALAEAIAAELRVTGGQVTADAVPLTRVAGTALDRVARHRTDIERQIVAYAETELLCHRAEHPPELVARQQAVWQPLADWATLRLRYVLARCRR